MLFQFPELLVMRGVELLVSMVLRSVGSPLSALIHAASDVVVVMMTIVLILVPVIVVMVVYSVLFMSMTATIL